MKLRDHPLMSYYGVKSWPPVWVNTRTVPVEKLTGEIGTLTRTAFFPTMPKSLFLIMELETQPYMGCLLLSEAGFCQQLNAILQDHPWPLYQRHRQFGLVAHALKVPGNQTNPIDSR